MVVDTSAIIAILQAEPELDRLLTAIYEADMCLMSAGSYQEAAIVIEARRGPDGVRDLKLLLLDAQIEIVPVSEELAEVGLDAYRRFGRGRHPAALNFADCFSYALAKAIGQPLLFKGADFSRTDLAAAPY